MIIEIILILAAMVSFLSIWAEYMKPAPGGANLQGILFLVFTALAIGWPIAHHKWEKHVEKTRMTLDREYYEVIKGKDTSKMPMVIMKNFPKSRGKYENLSNAEIEKLIPIAKQELAQ